MKYIVNYTDSKTGATSAIDTIVERDGYTAEDYINACKSNADEEWCKMLDEGTVELEPIETEQRTIYVVEKNTNDFDNAWYGCYTYDLEEAWREAEYHWNHLTAAEQKRNNVYVYGYQLDVDPNLDAEKAFDEATEDMTVYPDAIYAERFEYIDKIRLTDERDRDFSIEGTLEEIKNYLGESYSDCEDVYDLESQASYNDATYFNFNVFKEVRR